MHGDRSDKELVTAARGGDERAFGELVTRYKDAVFGVAFHRLGDYEDARDAAQEAFLEAYRSLPKLRRPVAFATWLYRIADRTAVDVLRRRRTSVPLDDVGEQGTPSSDGHAGRDDELAAQVRDALASLPDASRLALILHYVDGYSHREVANFLGTTASAVKARLNRARGQLRAEVRAMVGDRLKRESRVFEFEATSGSGALITGTAEAESAASLRQRLEQKGFRVSRVRRDRRTPEQTEADARIAREEAEEVMKRLLFEEALKYKAEAVKVALRRGKAREEVVASYLIHGTCHEVLCITGRCVYAPIRAQLARMAGVELREGPGRQTARIPFHFQGTDYRSRVIFNKNSMRLVPATPCS